MGVRLVVALAAALALAVSAWAGPRETATAFLLAHETPSGGFAEAGEQPSAGLTAWAALGLAAVGKAPASAGAYLRAHEADLQSPTDLELGILGERALGLDAGPLLARLAPLVRPDGRIGEALNSTYWGVLALKAAGQEVPAGTTRLILAVQARSGGWSWLEGVAPDADDTAAAVQALRAAGVAPSYPAIRRALAFLRSCAGRDGGFGTKPGAASNAQSTSWAIQALLAAGRDPGKAAFAYLARLQRPNGSVRYDARYATTPVWVTSNALFALSRRWSPLAAG